MPTEIPRKTEPKKTCTVTFANEGKTVECAPHTNLRLLAIEHDIDLYNGLSKFFNCQGHGLCGTCAVEITPPHGVSAKRAIEKFRFIQLRGNLRLACAVAVEEDIVVTKHGGMYGTKGYRQAATRDEVAQAYLDGKTIKEIAEEHQLPPARVAVMLQEAQVEVRRPGSAA